MNDNMKDLLETITKNIIDLQEENRKLRKEMDELKNINDTLIEWNKKENVNVGTWWSYTHGKK